MNRYRVEILLALLVVAIAGPLVHEYKAQQASRYLFTAAMWDNGTILLDEYAAVDPPILGVDRSVYNGHTLSDKAPLQPVMAVPFYAVYRVAGGEPATERRIHENLGLWWITFWMSTIPAALLTVLTYRFARRFLPETSLIATVGIMTGSILLPFAAVLFGHELAAMLLFAAFFLATSELTRSSGLLAAGLLAGAAVAVEYTAVVGVLVIGGYLLWRVRRRVLWYFVGGMPVAIGLGWYQSIAFGSPLSHPYRYSAFSEVTEEARPFFSIFSRVHPERILEVFFQGRGFFVATPLVIIGIYGLVLLARGSDRPKAAIAVTSLAMFAAFLLIPLFWGNPWGGESPGARYMTPAFPFLVLGVAAAWRRVRLLALAAMTVGTTTMLVATMTDPLISRGVSGGAGTWARLAIEGDWVPTIFTIAVGPFGWFIHAALVAVVARTLIVSAAVESSMEPGVR